MKKAISNWRKKWNRQKRSRKVGASVGVTILLYGVSMFVPLIGGWTSYPIAIMKCGKLPIVLEAWNYETPGMSGYPGPSSFSTYKDYVCTAQEAEARGYRVGL